MQNKAPRHSVPEREDDGGGDGGAVPGFMPKVASIAGAVSLASSSVVGTLSAAIRPASRAPRPKAAAEAAAALADQVPAHERNGSKTFKCRHTLDDRLAMTRQLIKERPHAVPVVLQTPTAPPKRLEAPRKSSFGDLAWTLRQAMKIAPHQALYFMVDDELPRLTSTMEQVYEQYADFDGFLYITARMESTFGGCPPGTA